jgi:uncharacterized membrane protein YeaQ/YmgE (transglycosylase-associated protein family)
MDLIVSLFAYAILGLIVGLIARAVVPTGRSYGCLGTTLLGIIGSVVGGTSASVLAGDGLDLRGSGWIGSIVGAVGVLALIRWNDYRTR